MDSNDPFRDAKEQASIRRDKKHNKQQSIPNIPVQNWATIIALFSNALIVDSVIINRNKTVQVILNGDFSNMNFGPDVLLNDSLALDIALDIGEEADLSSQQQQHHQQEQQQHRRSVKADKSRAYKSKKKPKY